MIVAALQSDIAWEAPDANFRRLTPRIRAAAQAGARLVVLPEMFACGFSMQTERVAEAVGGPSSAFLAAQAREQQVWVCGSVPERRQTDAKPSNTLVLAGPDGQLHRYRKIHPFTFAREHEHYTAGNEIVTVDVEGLRCTLFVCYDLRFADEFWQAANATDAYIVVANWPAKRSHHWRTLLGARAIENQAYVVGVNRVGRGGEIDYRGDSCIIDPWGEVLATGSGIETTLTAEVDPVRVQQAREKFPVLPDRRR